MILNAFRFFHNATKELSFIRCQTVRTLTLYIVCVHNKPRESIVFGSFCSWKYSRQNYRFVILINKVLSNRANRFETNTAERCFGT